MQYVIVNTWKTKNNPTTIVETNIENLEIEKILNELERLLTTDKDAVRTHVPNNSPLCLPRYYLIALTKDGFNNYVIDNIIGVKRHSNGWIPTKWALKPSFCYWCPQIIRSIYDVLTSTSQ